eukprot:6327507-Amphidinium_carterae.1
MGNVSITRRWVPPVSLMLPSIGGFTRCAVRGISTRDSLAILQQYFCSQVAVMPHENKSRILTSNSYMLTTTIT